MNQSIEHIISRPDTWRGTSSHQASHFILNTASANTTWPAARSISTGFASLDAKLQLGGWPLQGAVEVLSNDDNSECMSLFLPTMQTLSAEKRWQAFIGAPYTPYAPLIQAMGIPSEQILMVHPKTREELLWATEQAVRSTTCSVVFAWLGSAHYRYAELRKLQLAAADSDTLLFIFRSSDALSESTPVSLRVHIDAYREISVIKQRGGKSEVAIRLPDNPLFDSDLAAREKTKVTATRTGTYLIPVA